MQIYKAFLKHNSFYEKNTSEGRNFMQGFKGFINMPPAASFKIVWYICQTSSWKWLNIKLKKTYLLFLMFRRKRVPWGVRKKEAPTQVW